MRALTAAETAALQSRVVAWRNLVWITPKDRNTGVTTGYGFWDGDHTRTFGVTDGITQAAVNRSFAAAGSLLEVDDVEMTSDLAIRTAKIRLSPIDAAVRQAVFAYDLRLAPVQLYRVLLNPESGGAVALARCRFVGFVDAASGIDPAEGRQGWIELSCVSQLKEMTRANPDVGSSASQKRRLAGDTFLKDVAVVSDWSISWGMKSESVGKDKKGKKSGGKKGNKGKK